MKQVKLLCSIFAVIVMSSFLCAQTKVGFVNSTRAVTETEEGKAEVQKIENWAKGEQDKIAAMQNEANEKKQQLRNQQNMLSDEKKAELIEDIDRLETTIKRVQEDAQKEYERLMQEFGRKMDRKMSPLFNKYAKDNNYTMILYISPQSISQVIAYYSEDNDITDEIIALYNQTYPFTPGS